MSILSVLPGAVLALAAGTRLRDYAQDRWGVEDGLPQLSVLSITQDPSGYLWIGTQNGLARFDGLRFTTFDRASTGIDTTFVAHALVDRGGRLWFGTPRGVLRFEHGRLQALAGKPSLLSVNGLAETADGRLWFASDRGLYRIDGEQLVPAHLLDQPCLGLHRAGADLWIGGVGQLWRLRDGVLQQHLLDPPTLRVQRLLLHDDQLWLGTDDGLWRFDPASGQLQRKVAELSGQSVEALLADRDGNLWVGSTAALLRIQPDQRVEFAGPLDLAARPWVRTLFEDRNGDLWLGTHRESLIRLANSASRWIGERDGLSDTFVWSVLAAPDDGLWIGTNTGLLWLSADGRIEPRLAGSALPNPAVYNLAPEPDGSLLVGTRGGLARYAGGVVQRPPELAALDGEQVNALRRVGATLWIGTQGGLYRWQDGRVALLGPPAGSADARVRSILPLADGSLLLGTEGGVRQWRGERIETPAWAAPLEGQFVARLEWLRPGLLGLATLDSGLGLVRDGRLLLLTPEHGLPSRNGWTLDVVDDYLYVASINGVYRLALAQLPDPAWPPAGPLHVDAEQVIHGRGRARGHRIGCCNGGADARSARRGGQLVYGSTAGLVLLDTAAIETEPEAPRAVVEALHNGGRAHDGLAAIVLDGGSRDVAIDYTGLSLRDPEQIEFRYRLAGYGEDWHDAGTRRTAFFTHLPPGSYRFEVQARRPFGAWRRDSVPLSFRIAARWYESRLLQATALLLAGAALLFGWRRRIAAFRRRQQELERAVAERTEALAAANERLRAANRALALESRTDPLTGLSNRRVLLDTALNRSGVAAMLDLDHFKRINDQHGHAVGDQVLVEFARLLRAEIRPGDLLARWGGEEFLVLLARIDLDTALAWAERVRRRCAEHRFAAAEDASPDGLPVATSGVGVTVSIGLAAHLPDWQAAQELADAALYRAKSEGRNRVIGLGWTELASMATPPQPLAPALDSLVDAGQLRLLRSTPGTTRD